MNYMLCVTVTFFSFGCESKSAVQGLWSRRRSLLCFLAECCKRRLNQGSFCVWYALLFGVSVKQYSFKKTACKMT